MRRNLLLAVLVAGTLGATTPAMADHPTGAHGVEGGEGLRGAQRAHRRARRRERRREARRRARQRQARRRHLAQHPHPHHHAQVRVTARRPPVIVGVPQPVVVTQMAFDVQQVQQQAVVLTAGSMPTPYAMPGYVVGQIASPQLGLPASCPGYWAPQPQHIVSLPAGMPYFRVDVVSGTDTTLAIVTPDGQVWCNDDGGEGRNPRLEGQFPAGTYAVYVGTYRPGHRASYNVQLSERPVAAVAQTPTVTVQAGYPQAYPTVQVQTYPPAQGYAGAVVYGQAPPPPPPSCQSVLLERGYDASQLTFCEGAEPYCAAALLRAGHPPSSLVHCEGVPPACAVTLLEQGHSPASLVHCEGAEPTCAQQVLRSGQPPANLIHCD